MSTQRRNTAGYRMSQLLTKGETVFHLKDLAALWGITNYNTMRTTVKRYCAAGLLHRVYKGLYSVFPKEKVSPLLLGAKAIHQYCYLSTESILFMEGYISRKITYFTFVSAKSHKFYIGKNQFMSRQLKPAYLFIPEGLSVKDGIWKANTERAIADMLYFSPKYHFDRPIDWKKVKTIQQKIGYPLTPDRYVDPSFKRRST